ncbi:hypothetical protein GOP47_0006884 [Adiantum capillus-veneris]|uniref:RING-type E3 ubiquitin transferase n=1 Tax=Adiantum capillus-veneris TaxID=13818 RepID=A0A9D4ZN39_ADICA|nr:hypothetical protein GOP47_0006506 [Adiantum capillus-veneris]KAI5079213.1 hypothetical protein GOP47_0006884 [Adiantum capillus-veneris]
MYDLQLHTRRLLQETAASSPFSPNAEDDNQDVNAFDVNARFSPSMAIILVILLTAFFFMAFFSIYVKRCSSRQTDATRTPAALPHPSDIPSQGVDSAFLETLPLVAYSSSKKKGSNIECVVCLTDFEESEPLCQLPRCKHVFHKDCIDMWLFSHTTCPLCRRNVISDGSRSFRWGGGGSGSLRLSIGRRGSRRGSGRGSTTPSTPVEAQGRLPGMGEHANFNGIERDQLRRSYSTGHSLVKQAQSSVMRAGMAEHGDLEETQPGGGCFPLTPPPAFQRSRSFAALGDGAVPLQIGIGGWMREAGASLKRALSLKKVSPAGTFGASSSSSTAPFDRLGPA